jgi:hypothetical protein
MRRDRTATDRSDNFERRLKETMNSENEPEQITPNTAGAEELPSYEEIFPLTKQFNETNMRGRGGRQGNQSGRGRDQD